ncbi:unnamed protein product [Arctogadus glacialis]
MIFGADPCPDTHKYTQTTYTCLPAHHVVACEESEAELLCDSGQTIALIGAFYGRADRTTCPTEPPVYTVVLTGNSIKSTALLVLRTEL